MKKVVALAAIVAILTLSACNTKPSLVGKWQGKLEQQGQTVDAAVEFKNGGKMVADVTVQGIAIQMLATYTTTETSYTTTIDEFKIITLPPAMEQARPMMEANMKGETGKSTTSNYKFIDKDTVEMSSTNGQKTTWTRVK